ncbi:MAG: dephospho-CoA kinase [Deltaproteobacteria bacterium]|nr:dephospho-CoA kinase [Deltaproteobacteria bacterium]
MVTAFGDGILLESGEIDRKLLAGIIFGDPVKKTLLESLTHPALFEILGKRLEATLAGFAGTDRVDAAPGKTARHPVVIEAPLLFETGADRFMDLTVVISCAVKDQIERLMKRDGLTAEDAMRRISSQMPLSMKEERSDVVIKNTGSRELLKKKTGHLIKVIFSSCDSVKSTKTNLII